MTIGFNGKNLNEAMEKLRKVTLEQVAKEIELQTNLSERDLLCILSLYQFLIAKQKSKIFLTTEDSIVWKNRNILRKAHKIRITTLEKIKRKEEKYK